MITYIHMCIIDCLLIICTNKCVSQQSTCATVVVENPPAPTPAVEGDVTPAPVVEDAAPTAPVVEEDTTPTPVVEEVPTPEPKLQTKFLPTHYARSVSCEDMDEVLSVVSRRPEGRQSILKSPVVVRAMSMCKRETNRNWRVRRDKQAAFFAKKASRSKGCTTKAINKLRRVKATNKGMRTTLSKVS